MEKDIKNGQPFTLLIFNYLENRSSFGSFNLAAFLTVATSDNSLRALVKNQD
jgi:hypothetical protein